MVFKQSRDLIKRPGRRYSTPLLLLCSYGRLRGWNSKFNNAGIFQWCTWPVLPRRRRIPPASPVHPNTRKAHLLYAVDLSRGGARLALLVSISGFAPRLISPGELVQPSPVAALRLLKVRSASHLNPDRRHRRHLHRSMRPPMLQPQNELSTPISRAYMTSISLENTLLF